MFSVLHPITDLGTAERIVIRRAILDPDQELILDANCGCMAAHRRSPSAPPLDLKRQFKFEFNSYLRSALTLRGVSSLYISFADKPRRASVPHPIDERAAAGCALGEMIRLSISAGDRDQFQV